MPLLAKGDVSAYEPSRMYDGMTSAKIVLEDGTEEEVELDYFRGPKALNLDGSTTFLQMHLKTGMRELKAKSWWNFTTSEKIVMMNKVAKRNRGVKELRKSWHERGMEAEAQQPLQRPQPVASAGAVVPAAAKPLAGTYQPTDFERWLGARMGAIRRHDQSIADQA